MTTVTENDLKELKDLINTRFDELNRGQKALEIGQVEIKGQIAVIDSRLKTLETSSQKIPDLAEKVGELKNWKQIAVVVITAFTSGLIGGFIGWLLRTAKV